MNEEYKHTIPCCQICPFCQFNIELGYMNEHLNKCFIQNSRYKQLKKRKVKA